MQLLFLIVGLMAIKQEQNPLDQFQWKKRIVLIFGENQNMVDKQLDFFHNETDEIADRDLLIFAIDKEQTAFTEIERSFLARKYNENNQGFKVILIGKDGGVKLTQDQLLTTQKLFQLIDSMPMRQQEMRNDN